MKTSLAGALAAGLALLLPCAAQAVDVSGTLAADTVWSSGTSYRITGSVTVPAGVTLTVEPGVSVQVLTPGTYMLTVNGTLKVGVFATTGLPDPAQPVNFTTASSGTYWGGISIASGSTGSFFKNAEIQYAQTCVRVDAAGVTFDDVLIHNCSTYGLYVASSAASAAFRGSGSAATNAATAKIYSAAAQGIYNTGTLTVSGAEIYNNAYDGILSSGNSQISACSIHHNGGTSTLYYGVNWNNAPASGTQRLERSVVYQNARGGVAATLSTSGLQQVIDHNTFDSNCRSLYTCYEINLNASVTGLKVVDNIAVNGRAYGLYRGVTGGTVDVHHNLSFNNGSGNYGVTDSAGGVSCNPLFVSATNYRITSNSPARLADSSGSGDIGALAFAGDATVGLQGVLRQDLTLTAAAGPYDLLGDLFVAPGVTLTVQPGTRINAATTDSMKCGVDSTRAELFVQGTLSAAGTSASGITFAPSSGTTKGSWYGLVFDDNSTVNALSYLDVGYAQVGVTSRSAALTVSNSNLHHSNVNGLYVEKTTASVTVTGLPGSMLVTDSGQWGIRNNGALTATNVSVLRNAYGGITSTGNSQITGCEIATNGSGNGSGGFGVNFTNALTSGAQSLTRSVLHDNSAGGATVVLNTSGLSAVIESNTFDNDDAYSSTTYEMYLSTQTGASITVRNNIVTNSKQYALYRSGTYGTVLASYNLTNGNQTDYYPTSLEGAGSVKCSPLYARTDGTNYRITEYSPARGADSFGNDMGALAYIGDATPMLMGVLRSDRTLTAAGSPWAMPGDLIVPAGVTLTLEPGATVVPASSDAMKCGNSSATVELIVRGALVVNGNATDRAMLKPAGTTKGQWEGLRFEASSTGNTVSGLEVAYGNTCVNVQAPGLTLTNTTVHDCSTTAVQVASGASLTMTGDSPKYGGHFLFGSQVYNAGAYGISADGDLTLSNTELYGNYSTSVYARGAAAISGCAIHDTTYGWGISLEPSSAVALRVDHSVVHHNYSGGLRIYSSYASATFDHNTVDANSNYGLYIYASTSTTTVLKNNLVTNTSGSYGYGVYRYSGTVSASYNDVSGSTYYNYSGVTAGTGSLTVDPLYNYPAGNTSGRDYRLQPTSPARNADGDTPRGDMGALPYVLISPARVTLSPATASLKTGASQTFTPQAVEGWSNFPIRGLTYTFAAAPTSANFGSISPLGAFTAGCDVGVYPASVIASTGSVSGTSDVTIVAGDPASVSVTPTTNTLGINQTASFSAIARDGCGNPTTTETIDWSLTSAGNGTISASGIFVSGTRAGTFVDLVRAATHSTGKTGFATLTIQPDPVGAIQITPSPATIAGGASGRFLATARDAFNNPVAFTPAWSLNGCALGTLDAAGLFTAGATTGTCTNGVVATDRATGTTASATVVVSSGTLASITVAPGSGSVAVNSSLQFTATGRDGGGNTVVINPTWTLSGGGTIDTSGRFTAGCAPGTYAVGATVGSVTGSVNVTVTAGAVATLAVAPSSADVSVYGTRTFTASAQDSCGNAVTVAPVWAVVASGGTIGTSTGLFTASGLLGTFTNTVRATAGGVQGFATVRVTAGAVATLTLSPPNPTLSINGQQLFTAVGRDSYGNVATFTPTWSIVNGGGTIDAAGLFTAGSVSGTFANTVRVSSGSVAATTGVVVAAGPLASISIAPNPGSLAVRQTLQFTATGYDAGGNAVPITPTWSVAAGGGTIGATGLFTAGAVAGTYASTVKALDSARGIFATASVTVTPGALANLTVAPASATVTVGQTQQFTASGTDADGNAVTLSPTWTLVSCSRGAISSSGLFTAGSAPGSCPSGVKATSGTLSATASVDVVAGGLARIDIAPTSATLDPNAIQQFTAAGKDSLGNVLPVTISWSMATPAAGAVSATGQFTASTAAGSYPGALRATSGSVSATADITVRPGPLASMTISPASATLGALASQQFTATAKDTWNNAVAVAPSWSVVAGGGTISATGLFTAGAALGSFANTVKATSGTTTATASVTVVTGMLARVVVTPTPASAAVGGTVQFSARGEDAGGNPVTITPTWSVVAGGGIISATGLFTAGTAAGTFVNTVKATASTVTGFATVTVTPGPIATISLLPTSTTLALRAMQQFSATCRDASGNTVIGCPITWTLTPPSVGTVNPSGLFTAGTVAGTFLGAVKAASGTVSGSASVTINPGPLAQVSLTPNSVVLAPGATQQFTATATDAWGNALTAPITWALVNGGGTLDSSGLFTAGSVAGAYTNTVKASSGTFSALATVTISTGGLAAITVAPADPTLAAGATQQFTATGTDVFGNPVALTNVAWSAGSAGTIDATGLFTAGCAPGAFAGAVRATVGTVTGSTGVTVTPGALATLAITPASPTVATGATQQFTATGRDGCNNALPVTPTWTVTNAQAGTIDANGLFTASTTAGTYSNAVSAQQGSLGATASVTVVAGTISRVTITPATASVVAGQSRGFAAAAFDASGNAVTTTFTWRVIGTAGTITTAGIFTAGTAAGTWPDAIEVRASNGVSAYASVTVLPGTLSQIVIAPASGRVTVLGTIPFTAQARDANGNPVAAPIAWSVAGGGGAIDPASGIFTAGAVAGTFTNTVKATSGTVSATATVVVDPGPVVRVLVNPDPARIPAGDQQTFTATATDGLGNAVTATPDWAVVAGGGSMTAAGVLTAATVVGTYPDTVTATVGGVVGDATVAVLPGPAVALSLDPTSATLQVHASRQFTAMGVDGWDNHFEIEATWTMGAPGAGTLDANGLFTAGASAGSYPGAVVATAGALTASGDVTVTPGPLVRIALLPAALQIKPGERQLFIADGRDADENPIALIPTWTLLDPNAGTLGSSGLFTAGPRLGVYPDVVQASSDGFTGAASVTIVAPEIARVTVLPANPRIAIAHKQQFQAHAFDAKGNEVIGLATSWQLVNGGETAATLSEGGELTGSSTPGAYPNSVQATVASATGTTGFVIPTDFDADGMPDLWELARGFDPTNAADADGDPDRDGLKNVDEFRAGSDPFDADSDDDGVLDGNEVKPTEDTDGDGLANAMDPDSDGDGLPDGLEMGVTAAHADTDTSKGHFVADADPASTTDPLSKDTDGDGLEDGAEDLDHNGRVDPGETDPNLPNCATTADCKSGVCVDGVCQEKPATCDPACADGETCNPETLTCEKAPSVAGQSGCGCSTPAGGPMLGALGLLLALGLRRRR